MPRNVRNFWVEVEIDGYKEEISGGPKSSAGGFVQEIYMRDEGCVSNAVSIRGNVTNDDKLVLRILDRKSGKEIVVETQR